MEENNQLMSLEQQVSIAAGILTLVGILLAQLFHPSCIILALFT